MEPQFGEGNAVRKWEILKVEKCPVILWEESNWNDKILLLSCRVFCQV